MTLIVTSISRFGIIQASDSNLTDDTNRTTEGPKVFPLGFSPAALALSGIYSVGNVPMDTWMPNAITDYAVATGQPILHDFAEHLGRRLTNELTQEEAAEGSLIHIAGYEHKESASHPEMQFVRNVGMDASGSYVNAEATFTVSEDFWNRDYPDEGGKEALAVGNSWKYFNGFPPGRIAYVGVSARLDQLFAEVWAQPQWEFKPPETLEQQAEQLKQAMSVIG